MGVVEHILRRIRIRLELSHREDQVNSLVTWYFEFVDQSIYLFDNLKGADLLLD